MDRFSRIRRLIGPAGLRQLQMARVTVVGIGAVGGYAVEALARAGVGHLHLIDFDTFEESNLNRQIHALFSTLGQPKVAVARERVLDINPDCRVMASCFTVSAATLEAVLNPLPHLLVDAIDDLEAKAALLVAASRQKVPILSAMGAALRRDPTLVRVADLFATQKCPLARRLRKKLRPLGVGEGIRCVFSMEEVDFGSQQGEADNDEPGHGKPRPLGSLPTVTGIFGLALANEAIKMLIAKRQG